MHKILQIAPAAQTVYADFKQDDGYEHTLPVLVWCLEEDESGNHRVIGYVQADWLSPVDELGGFVDYRLPGGIEAPA